MRDRVVVEAPAKVNLHLGVGRRRPDGFHAVNTVLHAIDMTDSLTVRRSDTFVLKSHPDLEVPAKDNLVWRAAMLFAQRLGVEPLVEIELTKAIPIGAGLGGGSSDAAAVIAALAALWAESGEGVAVSEAAMSAVPETPAPPALVDPMVMEVAAGIGADVPFFLTGGTALLSGRGDELVRSIDAPVLDLVIVKPVQGVRTAAAYVEYDYAPMPAAEPDAMIEACESGDVAAVARALSNNLERAAITLVPEVADALAWVRSADGVLGACLAGSGSAVFGICTDHEMAEDAASEARLLGWWSVAARSCGCGVRIRTSEEAS